MNYISREQVLAVIAGYINSSNYDDTVATAIHKAVGALPSFPAPNPTHTLMPKEPTEKIITAMTACRLGDGPVVNSPGCRRASRAMYLAAIGAEDEAGDRNVMGQTQDQFRDAVERQEKT